MLLIRKQFVSTVKSIYYTEGSAILLMTPYISIKYKLNYFFYLLLNENNTTHSLYVSCLLKEHMNKLSFRYYQNYSNCIFSVISYIIISSSYGNVGRFRLSGRGYKAFSLIYNFLFKLGYSHLVYYSLPLFTRTRKKSKKIMFYRITGIWSQQINQYVNTISSFRIPDVYCSKGIFKRGQIFEQKEGKKAFTL